MSPRIESPIEERFLEALCQQSILKVGGIIVNLPQPIDLHSDGLFYVEAWPQYQIRKFRVDFYLEYEDPYRQYHFGRNHRPKLIVECDGHEFHERTKEQIQKDRQRDRILQSLGYPVFRFTGSEIWKDPFCCAESVIDFFTNTFDMLIEKEGRLWVVNA